MPPARPDEVSYAHRPLAAKLGIKPGFRVALLGAPRGFAAVLAPLPPAARLTAAPDASCDLYLGFVASRAQLTVRLGTLLPLIGPHALWLIWPKKSSVVKTDLDGNVVRESGLAAGLVDYKVCSVDATWSGLAFKHRAAKRAGAGR